MFFTLRLEIKLILSYLYIDAVTSSVLCIYIVLYCIVIYMYWRAPRLALVATWVIQSLQNKYVYI